MFLEGKIKTYNEERGFGFIQIEGEPKDLFFHIKDFPNKNLPPKVGENLKFRKVEENGKFKADNIVRLDIKVAVERHTPQSRAIHTTKQNHKRQQKSENNSSNFVTYMGILIIFGLAYAVFNKYQAWQNSQPEALSVQKVVEVPVVEHNFTCDGREHCSQMTSYEEALFFIRNCPNTKMDGDGDGIPCESQF